MSKQINRIEHEGKIIAIDKEYISVEILNKSACAACHAKGVCAASDESTRVIDVPLTLGNLIEDFQVGETVNVVLGSSLGLKAVWISYVIPLAILMVLLLSLSLLKIKELYIGLISIAGVALYYLGVYCFRNKLTRIFTFSIEKIINK